MRGWARHAPIGIIRTTTDATVTSANESAASALGVDPERLRDAELLEVFPHSATGSLHEALAADPPTEGSFEEYYPRIDRWLDVDVVRADGGVLVYVRDATERHQSEQRVERLERRLDRTRTIDALVATLLRTVIDAGDRREVARTVCDRLGTTDLYEFAWVGERAPGSDGLQVAAAAGDAPDVRARIEEQLASTSQLPERRAVERGETLVVERIAEDERVPRPVRLAAFGRGLQSALAVPMAYRGTVHGVLCVYSSQEAGFSEGERAGLETLGSIAGFAINAIRQEDLLFADTVTELTLEVTDGTVPFLAVAERTGCRLSLDGTVPRDDDTVVSYLRPDGSAETVSEAVADRSAVGNVRAIRSDEGDAEAPPLLEVELTGETPVTLLSGWGATVRTATYTGDRARLVAVVPAEGDLRQLVESVEAVYDGVELVAKERTERDPRTVGAFRSELDERLTERQRTVLRTAYLSDYFTSPRGSTAEEVADALGVTGPTVLYHLRRAQRKLLEAFFATDTGGGDGSGNPDQ